MNQLGFAEWVDPIDKINIEFADIHRKLAHTVDQGRVGALPIVAALQRNLFGLLCQA
jgi:hypothetical protein